MTGHEARPENERCLITGGAGFLGINLARFLLAEGYSVTSLDIAPLDCPDLAGRVRTVQGDIRDPDSVRQALEGAAVVVHAAAALPLYPVDVIRSTDVDGLRNLLEICQESRVRRVVCISSTAVYGIPDHHPLLEDDRHQGVGPYGEAKVLAEQVCLEYRARGMCLPILRLKSFVGPERLGVFALLYDWARDGRNFPVLGKGNNRYQLLDVADLCQAIHLALIRDAETANDAFNVAAEEFGTLREDFQAVLDHAGFGKRIVSLPTGLATPALKLLEKLHLSPMYQWIYETVAKDSYVSVDKARRRLGFNPRYSNRQALIRNYEWFIAHQAEFEARSGISHRAPWSQGALRLAKHLF